MSFEGLSADDDTRLVEFSQGWIQTSATSFQKLVKISNNKKILRKINHARRCKFVAGVSL